MVVVFLLGDPDWAYPMSGDDIRDQVNAALASDDRDEMLDLKDIIDDHNNLGL